MAHKGTVVRVAVWNIVASCFPLCINLSDMSCYIHVYILNSLHIQYNYKTILLIDGVIAFAFYK
jgi:hypothetical protein